MTLTGSHLRSSNPDIRDLTDSKLIKKAFLQAAWGLQHSENARMLDEIDKEARYRSLTNPGLPAVVEQSVNNGRLAYELAAKYERKLKEEGNSEQVQAWRARVVEHRHHTIDYHLGRCLDSWLKYQDKLKKRPVQPQTVDIPAVKLNEQGLHPNSLRALTPASEWDILIDEAGDAFGNQTVEEGTIEPHRIGRFVAVAIPDNKQLPPLKAEQHAAGEDTAKLQQIVNNLLQSKVGIFGFAANDPILNYRSYWMAHIQNLMRWVLLLLPMHAGAPCVARFRIEQRGDYTPSSDLTALREVLENEVKDLDPERYAGLKLDLSIIDKKDHAANGYVDAVANFWGSPTGFKAKVLKHTRLLSNCLLNPQHFDSLERLYMALDKQRTLQPEQWYQACAHQAGEGEHSLINSYLARLGERVKEDAGLWQSYLQIVQYRLNTKNYRLDQLGAALQWLERYAPKEKALPSTLELQLLASRLSLANHQGQTQHEYLARCFELAMQLQEENAPLACEALLRLASSGTNAFQFDQVQPMIEQWLQLPVAAPGLLNHGKLHSTLGQLLSFQGKNEQALEHFEQALNTFERLSDPQQVAKEQLQTASYRLCALMDLDDLAGSARLQETLGEYLYQVTGKQDLLEQVGGLARSGDVLSRIFAHHLLLRALISWPQALQPLREHYLAQSEHWQKGDNHPWPLIQFYRGWLCLDAGKTLLAQELMHEAVILCEQPGNGPTLHWMGAVLRQLASHLEVGGLALNTDKLNQLYEGLPLAPHGLLKQKPTVTLSWLHQVLPFNFH